VFLNLKKKPKIRILEHMFTTL